MSIITKERATTAVDKQQIIAIGIAGWFIPESYREAYSRYTPFLVFGMVAIAFISVGVWSRRSLP